MKWTNWITLGCIAAASLILGGAYVAHGTSAVPGAFIAQGTYTGAGITILALGGLWLLGHVLGKGQTANPLVWLMFIAASAIGLWLDLPPGLMLAATVATLCAWDLENFSAQMNAAGRVDAALEMERRHLRRLGIAALSALALAGLALVVRAQYSFGTGLVLAVIAIIILGQAIRQMVREPGASSPREPKH